MANFVDSEKYFYHSVQNNFKIYAAKKYIWFLYKITFNWSHFTSVASKNSFWENRRRVVICFLKTSSVINPLDDRLNFKRSKIIAIESKTHT